MSFKFGLNVKNKAAEAPKKPGTGKRKPLFDDEPEDDKGKANTADSAQEIGGLDFEDTISATTESSRPKSSTKSKKGQPPAPPLRKPQAKADDPTAFGNSASAIEAERHAKEAVELDASIYDYDAAYDALHAKNAAKAAAEKEDALQRRPKYMDSVFKASEVRKKDELRARDKLLQREREAEGDEFDDKEKFVTGAYKAQQEEAQQAEAEEEKRQAAEEEKRKKFGMQGFHKQMLMEEEKRHQEAMEAAAKAVKEGIKLQPEEKEKTDAEIAEELRKQGKNIVLNEEGQITDKRQLLTAGLNVISKPKPAQSAPTSSSRPSGSQSGYQGRNASQRSQRERQTQMIAEQIEQSAKRKADEEAEEQRKLQHASKSQKTAGEISSAKERYLQRKREAAAAKAAAAAEK